MTFRAQKVVFVQVAVIGNIDAPGANSPGAGATKYDIFAIKTHITSL